MKFKVTEDDLTNALFYNSSLPTEGSGSKAEAREQARVMLAGQDLLEACHGGPGAEHMAMIANLCWYADLLAYGTVDGSRKQIIIHSLREYAHSLRTIVRKLPPMAKLKE